MTSLQRQGGTTLAGPVTVEPVRHPADLYGLQEEWLRLWHRCPTATPFQSPAWTLSWWEHLGHGRLWSYALRLEGVLVGFAPLFIYTDPEGVRRILLLGTSVTDQMDLLVDPQHVETCLAALHNALTGKAEEWDLVDWQELTERAVAYAWPGHREETGSCPVISLPETVDQFQAGLSSGLRRNLRRYRDQLGHVAEVRLETASTELEEFLDAFFRLHQARWRLRDQEGMVHTAAVQHFHRAAATRFLRDGMLRFHGLRLGRELVATVYAFVGHGRAYSYLGGFEPSLAKYSPGTLIMGYAIEQAIQEGIREWDFLRGPEAYKYAWGARDRPNVRIVSDHVGGGRARHAD